MTWIVDAFWTKVAYWSARIQHYSENRSWKRRQLREVRPAKPYRNAIVAAKRKGRISIPGKISIVGRSATYWSAVEQVEAKRDAARDRRVG